MLSLEQAILVNVKSLSPLSPGGITLEWLTHLVSSSCSASQEQVEKVANELVAEGRLQKPFDAYLPVGADILIAEN